MGRPRKGRKEIARELRTQGKTVKQIAEELNLGERTVSRYVNQRPDGEKLEATLQQGDVERVNSQIKASGGPIVDETKDSQASQHLSLDELIELGVPKDQAPFVMASWDTATLENSLSVLRFWKYALEYLQEDTETPWDVCIDLALCRLSNEALPVRIWKITLDLLWRYKPWRGETNRRAYIQVLRSTMNRMEPRAKALPQGTQSNDLRMTARGLYVMTETLPKRLVAKYLVANSKTPLSLLLRGRHAKIRSRSNDEALEFTNEFSKEPLFKELTSGSHLQEGSDARTPETEE